MKLKNLKSHTKYRYIPNPKQTTTTTSTSIRKQKWLNNGLYFFQDTLVMTLMVRTQPLAPKMNSSSDNMTDNSKNSDENAESGGTSSSQP